LLDLICLAGPPQPAGYPTIEIENTKQNPKRLCVASWNVRTLLDTNNNNPERRSAIIAHELQQYNIDIAALSETSMASMAKASLMKSLLAIRSFSLVTLQTVRHKMELASPFAHHYSSALNPGQLLTVRD